MAKGLGGFGSQPLASQRFPHIRGKIYQPGGRHLAAESLKHIFLIAEVPTIYSCSRLSPEWISGNFISELKRRSINWKVCDIRHVVIIADSLYRLM
jgi:hypothetical protein